MNRHNSNLNNNGEGGSGRSAVKRDYLVSRLRERITGGRYAPGEQLPTRAVLIDEFGISSVTLQRALDQLIAEGFVRTDGRRGSFVVDAPPHLNHYGLVFPRGPSEGQWSLFWRSLRQAAAEAIVPPARVSVYYGLESPSQSDEFDRLVADVEAHTMAGLIFSSHPFEFQNTPVLADDGIPRVAIMAGQVYDYVAAITFRGAPYLSTLARLAARQNRRRIAMVLPLETGRSDEYLNEWHDEMAACGLQTRDRWVQGVSLHANRLTRNCLELLFGGPARERPDALYIADDNLVEPVTAALAQLDMRMPEELLVIGHGNQPVLPAAACDMHYVCYDCREMIRLGVAYIDARRRGEAPPGEMELNGVTVVEAVREGKTPCATV